MTAKRKTLATTKLEPRIVTIRGLKVISDSDLAKIYGVPTKRLNEQIKRNPARFPEDFEQTLRDIHTELAELNKEAAELALTIQQNFEELGI
jgi:hypothetical protein